MAKPMDDSADGADEAWLDEILAAANADMDEYVFRASDASRAVAEVARRMGGDDVRRLSIRTVRARRNMRLAASSEEAIRPPTVRNVEDPAPVKIVVAGGPGVGKTTFIANISTIEPLTKDPTPTVSSEGAGDAALVPDESAAMATVEFGRVSLARDLTMHLFTAPGLGRFWFMWDELCRGAIGAVVLVDTRRLAACFPVIDYFEEVGLPYVVGLNCFDGMLAHEVGDVREALSIPSDVPVVVCDARSRESTKLMLIRLVEHVTLPTVGEEHLTLPIAAEGGT